MKISRSKTRPKAKPKAPPSPERTFERVWNDVLRQQRENERLKDDVQGFARDIRSVIERQEQAYLEALCHACEHLLSFCDYRSLSPRQHEDLLSRVMDYLIDIASSPFSVNIDTRALQAAVEAQLDKVRQPRGSKAAKRKGNTDSALTDDLFGEDDDEADEAMEQAFMDELDRMFGGLFEEHDAAHAPEPDEPPLPDTLKASSINRLFRKLANVLHPDKERDESARLEKNRLMNVLLRARETHDIPLIFSLYAEHVGESPMQEVTHDLEGVTHLLRRHLEHLRSQRQRIIDEEPIAAVLYRRFYRKSPATVQRTVRTHLLAVERATMDLDLLCKRVGTVSELKRWLADTRPYW